MTSTTTLPIASILIEEQQCRMRLTLEQREVSGELRYCWIEPDGSVNAHTHGATRDEAEQRLLDAYRTWDVHLEGEDYTRAQILAETAVQPPDTVRLTGSLAIEHAERLGFPLCKHADPVEGSRHDVSPDEAREIASYDPALIYLDVAPLPAPQTLDALYRVLLEDDGSAEYADLHSLPRNGGEGIDWSSLPTFGGEPPADTREVWSWDADRLLVGRSHNELRLVRRGEG
jgi:hypothetical protein